MTLRGKLMGDVDALIFVIMLGLLDDSGRTCEHPENYLRPS